MMEKIESLTPEQEQQLIDYRNEWLAIGRSTDPIDRQEVEKIITDFYRRIGQEKPYFWFCDGPATGAIAQSIIVNNAPNLRDNLWDNLWDNLRDNLRDNLWANLWANLGDNLRDNLWDNLRDNLRDNLWANLWANLGDNLWDNLGANFRWEFYFWGNQDCPWQCFYDFPNKFLRNMYSQKNAELLQLWIELSKSGFWWHPYERIVFICDRPSLYKFDDRSLLHSENGPAIVCRDGWEVYCWHGINIPSEWIIRKPSAHEAITWDNMEQRRAACEIVGWATILKELNALIIDKNSNPFVGELLEVDIPDIGREKFLRVMCGTQREFALPVPPEMERASQAQAWLNFTTEDMYLPKLRT